MKVFEIILESFLFGQRYEIESKKIFGDWRKKKLYY